MSLERWALWGFPGCGSDPPIGSNVTGFKGHRVMVCTGPLGKRPGENRLGFVFYYRTELAGLVLTLVGSYL